MKRQGWMLALGAIVITAAGAFIAGCGGAGNSTARPSISNVNNSTTPTSLVKSAIAINGSNFLSAPGQVIFTQGSIRAMVTPSVGGWSNSSIMAIVPSGNGTTNFTVPGMVTVTVKTSGGTSSGVSLNLAPTNTFSVYSMTSTSTTALPTPLKGLGAVAVQSSNTGTFVVVAGGFNGTANVNTVFTSRLAQDATLGPWTPSANSLPTTLAHFGMVEANAQNSLVPANSHFIYVIGGQVSSSDTPGGTNSVYMASVDPNTGAVGAWKTLTSTLPYALQGPAVTISNGYVYVAAGLTPLQTATTDLFSAPINSDGTLGLWTESISALPDGLSFDTLLLDSNPMSDSVAICTHSMAIRTDQATPTSRRPLECRACGLPRPRTALWTPWTATNASIKDGRSRIPRLPEGR